MHPLWEQGRGEGEAVGSKQSSKIWLSGKATQTHGFCPASCKITLLNLCPTLHLSWIFGLGAYSLAPNQSLYPWSESLEFCYPFHVFLFFQILPDLSRENGGWSTVHRCRLTQEGLFRVNGNMKVVEHLRMQMENGVHLQLGAQGEEQVRAAASLLKLFLRLLPERVIPASLQPRFLQLLQDRSNGVQETSLRDLLKELPASHYSLLKYLCGFLTQVAANHVYNRMDIHNLATIFGPNFFQ
ncbi:protein FAM13A-like [Dipodomys spectabilis]|uniref:protein FAM13A-like n=1 Tax=Dipodomys spectabilis TaxID=105255 RepID=UPI001C540172|nr:protein FAM13A-like [Dipodomys spectabilis]